MLRIPQLRLPVEHTGEELTERVKKLLKCKETPEITIVRRSIDARKKPELYFNYILNVRVKNQEQVYRRCDKRQVLIWEEKSYRFPATGLKGKTRPVIIGTGPAGLFCGYMLSKAGLSPILLERGMPVEQRVKDVESFWESGKLNPESNVQFGEGGAGTFSDGKLNTQTHDGFNKDVLEIFARFGAPLEILYLNKPHIGSDKLAEVLKYIRKFITDSGGKYLFNTVFCGFKRQNGEIKSVNLKNCKTGEESELSADCVVAALGHSSRDTFEMLDKSGIKMEPRDFAIGVRIEHLAEEISLAQYGKNYKLLPAADYKLVSHAHERTVFTFCMCPGGVVIPAASEDGGVVVNGMSRYARNEVNSNSALMVQMRSRDFGEGLFDGMNFQRQIERRAFEAGGRTYKAPVQLYGDFKEDRISSRFKSVQPTYACGTAFAPLGEVLPKVTVQALKAAIPDMDKRLRGFASPDAVLTGVETRFSSPVRIVRDENCESVSLKGFYPCGEGSGYSGGITSSAADGLKVAEKIFEKFKNH